MTSRNTHRSKWSSASCSFSAGATASPRRLPSEVDATLTTRKSKARSTNKYPTVMRTVSLTAPNFAKQNAPTQPVQEQLLESGMLSSKSAPVINSACPTFRRNDCHCQVRNEQVRALTDWCLKFCIILSVINSQVRAEQICRALTPGPAVSSAHPTKKTIYSQVHRSSATVLL